LLSQGAREVVLLDNYALGSPDTVKSLLGDKRVKLVRGDILRSTKLNTMPLRGCDGVFAIAGSS
jgi:UDP-glucose 4-epimerase